ncbi:/ gla_2 / Glyceroaquaporin /:424497 Forward [Candidatus Hepatoplasma crinochetorum]|uniref:/ gla_2 / Glyceroaquaporin /:424497 Forward n=1 Tax=Candidatus Hepatoplasma crinochetorum TaxID=295596 RepID=A0A0G7ZL71_9MOLU|nr:/ gla_2 / Glyceroaquaporin /:424497 Forward [Candidatus Hepatoplasma crinochetorum]
MLWWGIALSEFFGTFFLIILGLGINARTTLKQKDNKNNSLLINSFGWAFAYFVGGSIAYYSGSNINPILSLSAWLTDQITFVQFLDYFFFQILGAFFGTIIIIFIYWDQFKKNDKKDLAAEILYIKPERKDYKFNFAVEILASFVLITSFLASIWYGIDFFEPLFLAFIIFAIALSLGGLSDYAVNPTRDFVPRICHFLFNIPNKKKTNWNYSWVSITGPVIGSLSATGLIWAIIAIIGEGNPFN